MVSESRTVVAEEDQALIRDLYPSLRRFAAVVGPAEVDPDDLVQEALLKRLEKGRLGGLDNPGAYLRRTMYNLASNQRRGFARRRSALSRLGATAQYTPVYPSDVAELLRLSPLARASLYLVAVEGSSYREVADLLGCSEQAARQAVSRGRRRLRSVLSEEEPSATA